MANKRFTDNPLLLALAGTEVLAGTSVAGGSADPSGSVAAGADIKIEVDQLRDYIADHVAGTDLTIITEASAFIADPVTHRGGRKLTLAGGDVTFDNAEAYAAGQEYNIRATAAVDLIEDGVTLTPPAGGTLALEADMAVTVVMTGATTGIVIGQTVPA